MTTKAPEALVAKIRQGNRFLLTSHVSPDGDSIGSALGLARVLRGMGKGALVWTSDPVPGVYRHLPGVDRVHTGPEPPGGYPERFDAVVALECPSLDRSGLDQQLGVLPILNIDHHLGNQHYGQVNWVDTAAPSVGEMVYRLARTMNVTPDAETANLLYMTIVTDTGGFRFSNATEAAFEASAQLVREGARPELVAQWIHENRPEAALRLLAEVLASLELHDGGRIATVLLTRDMLERAGADPSHTEGLVDYPRTIAGVQAVALLREREDGNCKVSLRSRGEVDVETIARSHGGGGHRNAAGFELEGKPEAVKPRIVAALGEALGT
ncbi:MAG TPA: bifunctional oligoribonuclease/PAP phosphatase NrnA [Thermoanaerobaculia bacterium]|nr:bifunctional oligoribonuclease/PAP phosphatase NrnA [Thermoanaerobaculia bacterium]